MKVFVITGSTTGIGFGLADALMALHCEVVINGRTQDKIDKACDLLEEKHNRRPFGYPANVCHRDDIQALWDAAFAQFGRIDFWLNNAGTIHPQLPFASQDPKQIESVVTTNMFGLMYGTQVALQGMLKQGHGQIFNMEGYGSDGMKRPGMAIYGSTKSASRYFTQSLILETKESPVKVCTMSPGIVVTDLLRWSYEEGTDDNMKWAQFMFNLVADRVEVVAPWMAKKILANNKHGAHVNWLSFYRILYYGFSYPFRKRVF